MSTSVLWKVQKIDGVEKYRYQIEFQFNKDTWNPTAVFIDDRTQKPPPNLVEGIGYKTIEWHEAVDFAAILGYPIIGF